MGKRSRLTQFPSIRRKPRSPVYLGLRRNPPPPSLPGHLPDFAVRQRRCGDLRADGVHVLAAQDSEEGGADVGRVGGAGPQHMGGRGAAARVFHGTKRDAA